MGFPDWTIELIMKCISSVSYEILINGIPSQKILPRCGLRQGDPLSPYIFVICTEVLSQCLRKEERLGTIKGVQICRGSQAISHLFFADDSIFFLEGKSSSSCSTLASTISNYCRASGQRINEAKSAIIISPSSSLSFAQDCFKIFRVSPTAEMGKYLGLPTAIGISEYGKSKRDIFNFLIDNVKKRTSSWNGLLLSSAGRLSLISSILSSLSTYFLSVFKMPVSVTSKIDSLLSQFWWRGSRTSKGISWCSKLFLSQPKGLGGLGIRNTRCFNQALLAKIGWNMLRDPSSLISRTIGVQLGLDWNNCVNRVETVKSKDSWICKGILWGAKTFTKHIAWMVGSESSLNVWTSPWVDGLIPIPKHYDLLLVEPSLSKLRVKDLISNSTWNVDMVMCFFEDSFIAKILAIPLSKENKEDFAFYKESKNGNYYVKKGYFDVWHDLWNSKASVKDLSRISSGCRAFIKKWLWHLPGPKKWIILHWKILTQTLSVGRELEKRGIGDGFLCRLCDRQCVESLEHLFRDCEFVSRLWSANHLGINASSGSNISIQEWVINWLSLLSRKKNSIDGVISFMCTIWTIWVTRNTHVYSNEPLSPSGSIRLYEHELSLMIYAEKERADSRKDLNNICLSDDDDFNLKVLHNGNTFPLIGPDLGDNHYLIYTDAAWRSNFSTGLGWVVKDSNDFEHSVSENLKSNCYAQSASQAEALAILEALNWAKRHQLLHVCVYSDCLQVVAQLLGFTPVNIDTKVIVSDILKVGCYFHCLSFCYAPRSCNKMAHRLAQRAINM
ncbi:uncharacterized protein LOC141649192 [Silene latifolia]|uniref:uncharacterized protein LOC141649192 n=1 Tax=Silene latifolia TaxID=37657 RepID=UPI003D787BC3